MGMSEFSGNVVDALNTQDTRNQDLLTQVIDAANEASADTAGDVTIDGNVATEEAGSIQWGGKEASIQGTGGVALLEYAKDAIQTAVSNVSGMGTKQIELKKIIDRKFQV